MTAIRIYHGASDAANILAKTYKSVCTTVFNSLVTCQAIDLQYRPGAFQHINKNIIYNIGYLNIECIYISSVLRAGLLMLPR